MRGVLALVVAMIVLWGGYWFAGSRGLERGATAWVEAQRAAGAQIQHGGITVGGFPGRFDLSVTDPQIADPATGLSWRAPEMQIFALAYKPWHVIAAFPPEQTFATPAGEITLRSEGLRASLVVEPGSALTLERLRLSGTELGLTSALGWMVTADELRLATRQVSPGGAEHELGIDILGLTPDAAVLAAVPELPPVIETVHLDAIGTFSAPLDRHAGQTAPALQALQIKDLRLVWGDLSLSGQGTIRADDQGLASGQIDLALTNWRKAVPLLVALGFTTPEVAPTWENALAYLAAGSDDLALPLTYRNGRASLGPIPLGPAPALR